MAVRMPWHLPDLPLPPGTQAADFPIPNRLNVALSLTGFGVAVALLWVGSLRASGWWAFGWGVLFSYWMLHVYALIHQAQHDCLHTDARVNYGLGVLVSTLFPAPFTMIRTTHQGHHLRNRTDHEMFDLYYPTDNRFMKVAQFYCILLGLFWPIIPIGGLLAAVAPWVFRTKPFRQGRGTGYLLGDIRPVDTRAIRWEMLLIGLFFVGLVALGARWQNLLIMYGCFAFNWSTRQYVSHSFTPRHILDGALNLRTNCVMSWLLLFGEWDLNHHRYPMVPWVHLPRIAAPDEPRVPYAPQYWRQWRGPRLCEEPAPETMEQVQLSLWESPTGTEERGGAAGAE